MSGMASDDAPAQVSVEGDVSDKKVEVQDQNEVSGMPSRQEEVLSFWHHHFFFLCVFIVFAQPLFHVLVWFAF